MDSNLFIHGQACIQFEKEFVENCGDQYCVSVGNGLDNVNYGSDGDWHCL